MPAGDSTYKTCFSFNDPAPPEIYTLSLHDALPICFNENRAPNFCCAGKNLMPGSCQTCRSLDGDRKSTRLNSSHGYISYAVFCLKKKIKRPSAMFFIVTTCSTVPGLASSSLSTGST